MNQPTRRSNRTAKKKKKSKLTITLISIASILLALVALVGIYAATLAQKFESTATIENAFPDEHTRPDRSVGAAANAENILLLGSDTRGKLTGSLDSAGGNRSDTMMVVHVPADRKNLQVMSMMRDSWVTIPGHGEAKLNAALAYGGVPLVVQTVESLIDVRIDHVAIVDFEGFKGITNALGGVSVNNAIAFDRGGYSFAKGQIQLNGDQALSFVRERKLFADGDYQRVRNQQAFIKAVMDKTLSRETLTNPVTVSNLVGAVAPYMAVDEGLNSAYAASLGFELRDIRSDDVKFFTMPTLGTGTAGGQSIVKVDYAGLDIIKGHLKADTLDEYEPQTETMR